MALASIFEVRSRITAAVVVAVLGVAGCATVPEQPPEQLVVSRAQARWDALLAGDFGKAYGFLGPGSRAVNSLEAYKASIRKGFWQSAKVESAKCEADTCEVAVRIEYQFKGSRVKTPLSETWVRQEGNWWYVLK